VNLVHLQPNDKIAAFCSVKNFEQDNYVFLATRRGIVKKTRLEAFANPRTTGIIALGVEEGDSVIGAVLTSGDDEIFLATRDGKSIRFRENDVRPMGRSAYGVKGIVLEKEDALVSLAVVDPKGTVLSVTSNGFGKRTAIEEYRLQSRGGRGIINVRTTERNGFVVGSSFVAGDEGVMLISGKGMIIRLETAEIATIGRSTQGVRLIHLEEGDQVVSVARLAERDDEENGELPVPDA
jgi:DNA gyrase subunit A